MIARIKFSLILTLVLILSAFMPVLNILIWHLNAVLLYVFGDNWNAHIWMNLLLSVLILIFFFRSQKQSRSITLGILSIFFLLPLFLYLFENHFSEDAPYFLQSLVGGLIAGGILITTEYFKK
ncbi:hypothetical protein SAMN05421761_1275 [Belliella pelovolcani]|uniref:Uncharacterized protein n=1 Tax=Belliella pelovolcani TaxID=529505 RepID=A0A1N7Q385_9BACT|nr:hypothetical protein SAMN05421761_1275 [Belliella pelovolcani]